MRYIAFFMFFVTFVFGAYESQATLELYSNMSRLNYEFNEKEKIHLQVPEFVGEDLRISSTCKVLKSELSEAVPLPKEGLEKEFSKLDKQLSEVRKKIKANKAKRKLLESYSLQKAPLMDIRNSLTIFEDTYLNSLNAEENMSKKGEELARELQKINMKQSYRKVKSLDIVLECGKNPFTTVSFPIIGLTYQGYARFNANTKKSSVDVAQESIIRHSLGNLLQNVDIKLFSFAYSALMNPVPFRPNYIGMQQKRKFLGMQKSALQADVVMEKANIAYDTAIEMDSKTRRFWQIKSKSLAPYEDNKIIFNKQSLHVKLTNYIDGYGSQKAYLQGIIRPKESILQRRGEFEIDGVLVGKRFMEPIYKDNEETLYFGENSFIEVEKEIEKDFTKETFFGSSKVVKKAWHYKITNKSKNKEEIVLVERLPISKHEDIKVELLDKTKPQKIEKNGKIEWNFSLKAGQSKEIIFGYSIEKPTNK